MEQLQQQVDTKQVMLKGINEAMRCLVAVTTAAKRANPLAVEVPVIQQLDTIVKQLAQALPIVNKLSGL